jgi:hypothetical protein
MNTLSQLDITSPDHISVITRDGKVTISVTKDGASVTLGFPIRNTFNTTPSTPLQQSAPRMVAIKEVQESPKVSEETQRARRLVRERFTPKLNEQSVKEIKRILADPNIMSKFASKTHACEELGRIYGVTACRIMQISKGKGWRNVEP